jgi:hypothetical protein
MKINQKKREALASLFFELDNPQSLDYLATVSVAAGAAAVSTGA